MRFRIYAPELVKSDTYKINEESPVVRSDASGILKCSSARLRYLIVALTFTAPF